MSFASQVAKDRGQPANVRIGVVASENPVIVNVQGALFTDVGVINGYIPALGDTVALLGQSAISADGSSWLLLGRVATADTATVVNETGIHVTGPSPAQTQGGSFAPMTGVSMTFTKRSSTTRLFVTMLGSGYAQAVNNGGLWGVSFNGGVTTSGIAKQFYNAANSHGAVCGNGFLPGIAAGTYTVLGMFGRYIGASNIVWDDNDDMSLSIREVV